MDHRPLFWLLAAFIVGCFLWYKESSKTVAQAGLTSAGAGDPQNINGVTQWLGLNPASPSNATDMTPGQILTTATEFVPGSNTAAQIGVPTASTASPSQALASVPQVSGVPAVSFPVTETTGAEILPSQSGTVVPS